ncbi:chitin deacetylase [Mortierella sp. NVP41]|nr:chitin deacetylase [Mortierella sp. NVP41]
MVRHLGEKLSATFFIVGSRVLEYPDILKEQVASGHHIGMHTWSHGGLTTLTNEQIVTEIKWTEKIIRDVTGLTMKYVLPPYDDCDNRVREILRQMGYTIVIWSQGWDTNDWRPLLNMIKAPEIISTFKNALDNVALVKDHEPGRAHYTSVPLSNNSSPKSANGAGSKNSVGGGNKEVTTGELDPAGDVPSKDSSSHNGGATMTTKGKTGAAVSFKSMGVVTLGGIVAVASYFLTL